MSDPIITQDQAEVVGKKNLGSRFVELWILQASIARTACPGQFVMVRPGQGFDPLLNRPLGIFNTEGDCFALLFEIVGRGTEMLAQVRTGDRLSVIGPLGNTFTTHSEEAWLIAGGRGIVPLFFLASNLEKLGIPFFLFYGVQNREELILADYLQIFPGSCAVACEEDTGERHCGTVLDLFVHEREGKPVPSGSRVYACGPEGLYRSMRQLSLLSQFPVEISLEARMGCGFGVCLSCAVPRGDGQGFYHVCTDGPVFQLTEVFP